jgi:probable HAF family extracellular repeat protein
MKRLLQVFVAMLLCVGTASGDSSQIYRIRSVSITTLGALRGSESVALDINIHGHVVGWNKPASGRKHAFLYWSGTMVDISGSFSSSDTIATGINRHTHIVGTIFPPGSAPRHGFYWSPATAWMVQLHDVIGPKICVYRSDAEAINDIGYITGSIGAKGPDDNPNKCGGTSVALWSSPSNPDFVPGTEHVVPDQFGKDLNNSNTVVGYSKALGQEPARWRTGGATYVPSPPPNPNYDGWSYAGRANGINDEGTIVGSYNVRIGEKYNRRAIIWDGVSENSTDLGIFPGGADSFANDVNPQRFVVGYADQLMLISVSPPFVASRNAGFIWHADFGMVALPRLSGAGECEANAVNQRSSNGVVQVVGFCINSSGLRQAVRWDVVTELYSRYDP